jgi:hypothetical protein
MGRFTDTAYSPTSHAIADSFFAGSDEQAAAKSASLRDGFVYAYAPGSHVTAAQPWDSPFGPPCSLHDQPEAPTPGQDTANALYAPCVVTPGDAMTGGKPARKRGDKKKEAEQRKKLTASRAAAKRALETENASLKVKLALLSGAEVPDHVGDAALRAKNAELEDQLAGAQRANSGLAFQVTALKMKAARVDELLEQNATLEGKNAELERETAEYAGAAGAVAEIAWILCRRKPL